MIQLIMSHFILVPRLKKIMLKSAEHEILNAHKYKSIKKFRHFSGSDKPRVPFFPFLNLKMPTVVGILKFRSWRVEHEIFFITMGPLTMLFAMQLFLFLVF